MSNKLEYSQQFARLLSIDHHEIMSTWWINLRDQGGLRLTPLGFKTLSEDLEIESYRFTIPVMALTAKNLLLLDKKITCPYFLERDKTQIHIVLFGGDQAIMATLYGDVQRWLDSLDCQ